MLSELCDYNNIDKMIAKNTINIQRGTIDIFGLFDDTSLIGELRTMYEKRISSSL